MQAALAVGWTKERLIELLEKNNLAVERALLVLFERQTADEQTSEHTRHKNGRGFTAFDAEIFSSFAKQVQRSRNAPGQRLSRNQLECCRKRDKNGNMRIACYWKQLLEEIENKQNERRAA